MKNVVWFGFNTMLLKQFGIVAYFLDLPMGFDQFHEDFDVLDI